MRKSFRQWISDFPGVTDVTSNSFFYTPEGRKYRSLIKYEETVIQERAKDLSRAGRDLWGRRSGLTRFELGYRLLTVHLDDAIDFYGRTDDSGVYEITSDAVISLTPESPSYLRPEETSE
jgi:hypothetical protein